MAAEHIVGSTSDFPEGSATIVTVGRREIGIFNVNGRYYGLPNICPHQNGPLCRGDVNGTMIMNPDTGDKEWALQGEIVRCAWHFLEFKITTGECLAYPEWRVRTYDVRAKDGKVVVLM